MPGGREASGVVQGVVSGWGYAGRKHGKEMSHYSQWAYLRVKEKKLQSWFGKSSSFGKKISQTNTHDVSTLLSVSSGCKSCAQWIFALIQLMGSPLVF